MNQEESLALFEQGRDAWNAWANELLAQRRDLEAAGTWTAGNEEDQWNDETRAWHSAADVDFSIGRLISTNFSEFVFPGRVQFFGVSFRHGANFESATFNGEATFENSRFDGETTLSNAVFSDTVNFDGAQFDRFLDFSNTIFGAIAKFTRSNFMQEADFAGSEFFSFSFFSEAKFNFDARFDHAKFRDDADFGHTRFSNRASFSSVHFEKDVTFKNANFDDDTLFVNSACLGLANFAFAKFAADAAFHESTFSGPVSFQRVSFVGDALFESAQFSDDALFEQAKFNSFTSFSDATFKKKSNFVAIESSGVFTLSSALFLAVPNFVQAHFVEAPRLDNIVIQPSSYRSQNPIFKLIVSKGDLDRPAQWRALKRLAVQSHDHHHELEFFQNKLRSRRWSTDRPWHAVFWFGLFYEWFSGFGRSIIRPLIWWGTSFAAFAPFYLLPYFDRAGMPFSVFRWIYDRWIFESFGKAAAPSLQCLSGAGDPWWEAFRISAHKALLLFGVDIGKKLQFSYACLYGVRDTTTSATPVAQIPDFVIAISVAQHIVSAVLLFLFLLAVRNNFRIK